MADSLLEQLKATVGRELVFQAPDEIGRPAFRQYALAVGDFNPLYSDREQAGCPRPAGRDGAAHAHL